MADHLDRSPSPESPAAPDEPLIGPAAATRLPEGQTTSAPHSTTLASQEPHSPAPKRPPFQHPRRQSSFAQPRPPGTPRTSNRVRFDVDDAAAAMAAAAAAEAAPTLKSSEEEEDESTRHSWLELDRDDPLGVHSYHDPVASEDDDNDGFSGANGHANGSARLPLLTGIEAPSVTLAEDFDFNPEDHLESARPRSGMKSAFMNMANSIIGAGIIGQPYVLRQGGLVSGLVLLVALTIIVDWTIRLIVINSKLSGTDSFQATVHKCFGHPGLVAISLAQWLFAFGGMIAFCVIVGDTIPHIVIALFPSIQDSSVLWLFASRRFIIILLILGVSYPLSLYRDIAKLAKASFFALVSMLVIIVAIITQDGSVPADMRGKLTGSIFINNGIFQAIGVISFAFVCHHNSLLIYGSLRKPTLDRFARVTHYSTAISMVACITMALAGFLTFGDKTQGNVLNNYPSENVVVNAARLCFGLNMLTTFPLECFVCREVMNNYYFPGEPHHPQRHLLLTTSLVVSAMALSLITCDLGVVFELIGATSACALAYILPPLCYIKLSTRTWRTWVAWVVVAFGCTVMAISLVQAAWKIIRHEGGTEACAM